jgi:hypothetical protein
MCPPGRVGGAAVFSQLNFRSVNEKVELRKSFEKAKARQSRAFVPELATFAKTTVFAKASRS